MSKQDLPTQADAALSHLPFIPCIIIHGHRWLFVLSTRSGEKTLLWTERQFGSTQSRLEVYQVVAGLRELAKWTPDVYLPWLQNYVLRGFEVDESTQDGAANSETQP